MRIELTGAEIVWIERALIEKIGEENNTLKFIEEHEPTQQQYYALVKLHKENLESVLKKIKDKLYKEMK